MPIVFYHFVCMSMGIAYTYIHTCVKKKNSMKNYINLLAFYFRYIIYNHLFSLRLLILKKKNSTQSLSIGSRQKLYKGSLYAIQLLYMYGCVQ